jgi:hypothetical protein
MQTGGPVRQLRRAGLADYKVRLKLPPLVVVDQLYRGRRDDGHTGDGEQVADLHQSTGLLGHLCTSGGHHRYSGKSPLV